MAPWTFAGTLQRSKLIPINKWGTKRVKLVYSGRSWRKTEGRPEIVECGHYHLKRSIAVACGEKLTKSLNAKVKRDTLDQRPSEGEAVK